MDSHIQPSATYAAATQPTPATSVVAPTLPPAPATAAAPPGAFAVRQQHTASFYSQSLFAAGSPPSPLRDSSGFVPSPPVTVWSPSGHATTSASLFRCTALPLPHVCTHVSLPDSRFPSRTLSLALCNRLASLYRRRQHISATHPMPMYRLHSVFHIFRPLIIVIW